MSGARADEAIATPDDRAVVVALRCGSAAAIREFVLRYRPMLVIAAQHVGIRDGDCEEMADEVLHDAALRFMDPTVPAPLAVRAYLLRSLRNRVVNAARSRTRRGQATTAAGDAASEAESYFEHAVVGCASEYAVRASHGPAWEGPPVVAPALARLATALVDGLSPTDRLVVVWLSHHVPQQDIAAWLGMGYDATSKRIRRLRARLQRTALSYAEHLDADARGEVMAFLGRTMQSVSRSGSPTQPSAWRSQRSTPKT